VDSRGVPWFSLIVAFVLGLVFLLPFPSWHSLVGLVTSASVLMFAGAPLSMGAFRKQVPDHHRPYRMPGATVLGPVAFVVSNLIILWSGFTTVWKLGIAMVIGYVLIGIFMAIDTERPKLQWKSAQWLPVYLLGMGIVTWLSSFGRGTLGFGWDMLVVIAFSLVIYYWAMASHLPSEEMQALVARQSGEHDPNLEMPAA
jgi:amino acid transporter